MSIAYRKKPVVIEAVQIPSINGSYAEMPSWLEVAAGDETVSANVDGTMTFIIRGVKGELYSCKPDLDDLRLMRLPGYGFHACNIKWVGLYNWRRWGWECPYAYSLGPVGLHWGYVG